MQTKSLFSLFELIFGETYHSNLVQFDLECTDKLGTNTEKRSTSQNQFKDIEKDLTSEVTD